MLSSVNSNSRSNSRKALATDACKGFDDPTGTDEFTPQELLERIGKDRPGGAVDAEKAAAAKAAFETSHDNTLMRAWEYTVATMVEKHPAYTSNGTTLREGIGNAVNSMLTTSATQYATDNALSTSDAATENAVASHVANQISNKLNAELEARYDPGVGSLSGATSPDGARAGGGFASFFRGKEDRQPGRVRGGGADVDGGVESVLQREHSELTLQIRRPRPSRWLTR